MSTIRTTALILAWCSVAAGQEATTSIEGFVGKDICELDAKTLAQFTDLFRSVTGNKEALAGNDWEFVPQRVYVLRTPEPVRFFLEIAPGRRHPGFCGLRVHHFDEQWQFTSAVAFSTGYRTKITDVRKEMVPNIAAEAIVVTTISAGPWSTLPDGTRKPPRLQRQYYACVSGSLMLVRREDEKGHLVRNNYANWTVPEVGMHYPTGSVEQMCDLLETGTNAEVLAVLVWLSGSHLPSDRKRLDGASQETLESAKRFEQLIAAPQLREIIAALRQSENQWVSAYAQQVSIGEQGHIR